MKQIQQRYLHFGWRKSNLVHQLSAQSHQTANVSSLLAIAATPYQSFHYLRKIWHTNSTDSLAIGASAMTQLIWSPQFECNLQVFWITIVFITYVAVDIDKIMWSCWALFSVDIFLSFIWNNSAYLLQKQNEYFFVRTSLPPLHVQPLVNSLVFLVFGACGFWIPALFTILHNVTIQIAGVAEVAFEGALITTVAIFSHQNEKTFSSNYFGGWNTVFKFWVRSSTNKSTKNCWNCSNQDMILFLDLNQALMIAMLLRFIKF